MNFILRAIIIILFLTVLFSLGFAVKSFAKNCQGEDCLYAKISASFSRSQKWRIFFGWLGRRDRDKTSRQFLVSPEANTPTPTKVASPTPLDVQALPEAGSPTPVLKAGIAKWGTYTGWQVSDIDNFEQKVGEEMDFIATFVHWGNENQFPLDLGQFAKEYNKTLVIYWEAMDYNVGSADDTRFSYNAILAGRWDTYVESFKKSCQDYGGPVILIPFEEMNGNWYPWSGTQNGNSPAKHVQAYRFLRQKFAGVNNVKFGWDINVESEPDTPDNAAVNYYPGGQYVDFVGVNGFNFGSPWQSFSQIFDKSISELKTYNKPIFIFSMACAEGPSKALWIKDAVSQINSHPEIYGWIWFNENKEKDWRIWSDVNSLSSFKEIVQ